MKKAEADGCGGNGRGPWRRCDVWIQSELSDFAREHPAAIAFYAGVIRGEEKK